MTQHRQHFYMVSATIHFVRSTTGKLLDEPKQQTLNLVIQLPEKKITPGVLNGAREALFERLNQESGIPTEDCRSIVFNNIFHLGFMTTKEFHEENPNKDIAKPH